MQVVSTNPTMQAVASTGGMSVKAPSSGGSAGTVMLGSTTRDRLWVRPGCNPGFDPSAVILPSLLPGPPAFAGFRLSPRPAQAARHGTDCSRSHCWLTEGEACLVIVLTHDPHRLRRL